MTATHAGPDAAGRAAARTRARVGIGSGVSLAVVLAGVWLVTVAARERAVTRTIVVGYVLLAVGLVAAGGCLRHGYRNEHERGRWFALLALVAGLLFGSLAAFDRYRLYGIG